MTQTEQQSWRREVSQEPVQQQHIVPSTATLSEPNSVIHVVGQDDRNNEQQSEDDKYHDFISSETVDNQQHNLSVKENAPERKYQDMIHIIPVTKLADTGDVPIYNPQHGYRVVSFDHDLKISQVADKQENDVTSENSQSTQPFKCTFCVKAFKQKSHLNHHVRVKHLKGEHLVGT